MVPLDVGSLYWELRDSLVNCELMMLRTLQFHVTFNNPHKVIFYNLLTVSIHMYSTVCFLCASIVCFFFFGGGGGVGEGVHATCIESI